MGVFHVFKFVQKYEIAQRITCNLRKSVLELTTLKL